MVKIAKMHSKTLSFTILMLGLLLIAACGQQQAPAPAPQAPSNAVQPAAAPQEPAPEQNALNAVSPQENPVPAPEPNSSAQTQAESSPTDSTQTQVAVAVDPQESPSESPGPSEPMEAAKTSMNEGTETTESSQPSVPEQSAAPESPVMEKASEEVAEVVEDVSNLDALDDTFFLEILVPEEDPAFVGEDSYVVFARTRIDAAVSVNDELVDVDEDGILEAEVALEEGPNIIEVVASVENGEEQSAVLTVFYLPEEGG